MTAVLLPQTVASDQLDSGGFSGLGGYIFPPDSDAKKMENKIGAAFATSADPSGGKETTIISIIQALLIYGMIVVGDPLDATGHYGVSCLGAPDHLAAQNAAKLGRRVAELVKKLQ